MGKRVRGLLEEEPGIGSISGAIQAGRQFLVRVRAQALHGFGQNSRKCSGMPNWSQEETPLPSFPRLKELKCGPGGICKIARPIF